MTDIVECVGESIVRVVGRRSKLFCPDPSICHQSSGQQSLKDSTSYLPEAPHSAYFIFLMCGEALRYLSLSFD